MSDDLVEMARLAQHDERMATGALYGDLADRIEELEAKQKKAAGYFAEIILHCANFGRGVPSINERIIERCEDTAADAIDYLTGGKDE